MADYTVFYAGVIKGTTTGERMWRVDVAIKRTWPFSVVDRLRDHKDPIRTFIGDGSHWYELRDDQYFGAGRFGSMLNELVAIKALELVDDPMPVKGPCRLAAAA